MIKYNVAVVISTYNGEKYITEQILSIQNQVDVNVSIYIRDDGSTDNTVEILKTLKEKEKIKDFFYGPNIGYSLSFTKALTSIKEKYDYYAFSDQDDIWEKNKLYIGIKMLINSRSLLYFSSISIVDSSLNYLYKKEFSRNNNFISNFIRYSAPGCTFIFTNELKEKIFLNNASYEILNFLSYDSFIMLISNWLDVKIIYDNKSYILHRIHNRNATLKRWNIFSRIKSEVRNLTLSRTKKFLLINYLLKEYPFPKNNVNNLNKEFIKKYLNYKNSFREKLSFLLYKELRTGKFLFDLYYKLLILIGLF